MINIEDYTKLNAEGICALTSQEKIERARMCAQIFQSGQYDLKMRVEAGCEIDSILLHLARDNSASSNRHSEEERRATLVAQAMGITPSLSRYVMSQIPEEQRTAIAASVYGEFLSTLGSSYKEILELIAESTLASATYYLEIVRETRNPYHLQTAQRVLRQLHEHEHEHEHAIVSHSHESSPAYTSGRVQETFNLLQSLQSEFAQPHPELNANHS